MEDSFEIGTIKETNEEYYLENDENAERGYPKRRTSAKGPTKQQTYSRHSDGDNVLRDRTNKVVNRNVDSKHNKSKNEQEKGSKNKHVSNQRGGKGQKEEDSLSSLSGFSGSDNEEHDPRFRQEPDQQYVQQELEADEEEEDDELDLKMPTKSKDQELNERFRYYEELRKKAEEEKRLAGDQQVPKYKRPQTAGGVEKGDFRDVRSSHTNLRQEHHVSNAYMNRPQTANPYRDETQEEEQNIVFKPVYTKPYHQHLIEKKKFNYSLKRFNTLPKKSDPVSRFNAFRTEWNKTKFLKSNSGLLNGRNTLLASYDKTYVKTSNKKF